MSGILTLTGTTGITFAGQGTLTPYTINGNTPIGEVLPIALASGDNTINVPLGAVGIAIIAPFGNSTVIKYRTSLNSGDVGLPINTGLGFFAQQFPTVAPTTIILNAASSISAFTQIWFI